MLILLLLLRYNPCYISCACETSKVQGWLTEKKSEQYNPCLKNAVATGDFNDLSVFYVILLFKNFFKYVKLYICVVMRTMNINISVLSAKKK